MEYTLQATIDNQILHFNDITLCVYKYILYNAYLNWVGCWRYRDDKDNFYSVSVVIVLIDNRSNLEKYRKECKCYHNKLI